MQEELTAHEEEGEVVKHPADEEETAKSIVFDDFGCV
jgi:hypothetical protein